MRRAFHQADAACTSDFFLSYLLLSNGIIIIIIVIRRTILLWLHFNTRYGFIYTSNRYRALRHKLTAVCVNIYIKLIASY